MFFSPRPHSRSFAMRLAVRAAITSAVAIAAAWMVQTMAMPKLQGELKAMNAQPPAALRWVGPFEGRLIFVPVPALLLGLAALASPSLRLPLGGTAMALALAAFVIIVCSLAAALAPMYQVPADLGNM